MEEKRVLIVCEEPVINDVIQFLLEKVSYKAEVVDNPKDAVSKIENNRYHIVIIGKNKGTVVKPKLAEIIYNKSSIKPYIIIYKEPGEIIQQEPYLFILPRPTFHEDLIDTLKKAGLSPAVSIQTSKIDINNFIESRSYKIRPIHEFFKNLKGNIKFFIKAGESKVVGFTMGTDLYLLYSDLDDPYSLLKMGGVNITTEPLSLGEFLNLPVDSSTFKINLRDFVVKSIEGIDDKSMLLSFLPSLEYTLVVKAPAYVMKQIDIIDKNIDVDYLIEENKIITLGEVLSDKSNVEKIKAVVCMYLLNMIDVEMNVTNKNKYDVKIKKSFLKKIIEKIRGL